jgi:hypothetical protein
MIIRPAPFSAPLRSLRIWYANPSLASVLGATVQSVKPADVEDIDGSAEHWVDAIVVGGATTELAAADQLSLAERAATRDIPVILAVTTEYDVLLRPAASTVIAEPPFQTDGDAVLHPLVETGSLGPEGSMREAGLSGLVAVHSLARDDRKGVEAFIAAMSDKYPELLDGDQGGLTLLALPAGGSIADILPRLRKVSGVLDHRTLHETPRTRAGFLAELTIASIPFVLLDEEIDPALHALLGSELTSISSGDPSVLNDLDNSQRLAVRQRRIGVATFTEWVLWRGICNRLGIRLAAPPKVSVLLPTRRPEQLQHAVAQVRRQSYPELEVIVILHGEKFADVDDSLLAGSGLDVRIIRGPEDMSFGEVLNLGVDAASGGFIAKMDDDDWYSSEHLADLMAAVEYSGASFTGKGSEWVYLEEIDRTVRRPNGRTEASGEIWFAGGAFVAEAGALRAVGGFRRSHRHVDRGLTLDAVRHGFRRYRTHGFGFVLHRKESGHTWEAHLDAFLDGSTTQIRGLAIDEAMLDGIDNLGDSPS